MVEPMTLYMHKASPFSHRVMIALEESGVKAEEYHVDLVRKPNWFVTKVNPLGTVPALSYGKQPAPDQPTEDAVKICESMVIVEFIADLFSETKFLPSDPVERARARTFASTTETAIFSAWKECIVSKGRDCFNPVFKALDFIQSLLPDDTVYAIGDDFTIADIAIAPWFSRIELLLRNDIFGKYGKGAGLRAYELYNSFKYVKLRAYARRLEERPSVKNTFLEVNAREYYIELFAGQN